jgi:glycosyltransferase involved in cell wall biosynthesis
MQGPVFIILACYNESAVIRTFLNELEQTLKYVDGEFVVVVIDDGSTDDTQQLLRQFSFSTPSVKIKLLRLEYNTGHQSALEQGILYAHSKHAAHAIIMDSDGEDDPAAIPELLILRNFDVVHVFRGKREEQWQFRFSYSAYKLLFRLITGRTMNFGNYCMINRKAIEIIHSRTFIHLAAFLSRLNLKSTSITSNRRSRIGGTSKMTFSDLIHHGFRSFVEYAEEMVMVFLRLFMVMFVLFIATMGYILYLKLFTTSAILGWTSTLGIGLLTSALVCIGFFITGILLLNLRHSRKHIAPAAIYKEINSTREEFISQKN